VLNVGNKDFIFISNAVRIMETLGLVMNCGGLFALVHNSHTAYINC